MEKLIEKLSIHQNSPTMEPQKAYFTNNSYSANEISEDNFKEIPKLNEHKTIIFIDGGNAQLINRPQLSLQLVRVFAVAYQEGKKLFTKKKQAYVLTKCILKNNEMLYTTECFGDDLGLDKEDLEFNINDETLREGIAHGNISKMGDVTRRFAELALAKECDGDIIILDGTLQAALTNEEKYLNELYNQKSNNTIITAMAKNTNLITNTGQNVSSVLDNTTQLQTWYYTDLVTINHQKHKAELFFTKLHKKSNFIFRIEIFNEQKESLPQLISTLSRYSNDAALPGYPYGLIVADQFARVTNQEKEHFRTLILAKIKHKNGHDKASVHEILDTLQF